MEEDHLMQDPYEEFKPIAKESTSSNISVVSLTPSIYEDLDHIEIKEFDSNRNKNHFNISLPLNNSFIVSDDKIIGVKDLDSTILSTEMNQNAWTQDVSYIIDPDDMENLNFTSNNDKFNTK